MKRMQLAILVSLLLLLNLAANAQTWVRQTSGISRNLADAFFLNADTGWVVGDFGTVFETTNGGQNWANKSMIYSYDLTSCYFVNKNTGWVGGPNGVFKTTDGGSSWNPQTNPDYINKVYFYDESNGYAVGGSGTGSVYVTTDGGSNWTEHQSVTGTEILGVQSVDALNVYVFCDYGINKSTNGGLAWTTTSIFGNGFGIASMYFVDPNTGFVGGHNDTEVGVYKTTDGGTSWVNKTPGLLYKPAYIKFFDGKHGIIAGGAFNNQPAVIVTTDGGESWTNIMTSVPGDVTRDDFTSEYFVSQNVGWAVGSGGSILKYENTTGIKDDKSSKEMNFSLNQNYPNPFNPSTQISYAVGRPSYVTLKIYDVLGNIVATLVNEMKPAGNYSINFNASSLSSGVYFYTLSAGNFVETKKLILMK